MPKQIFYKFRNWSNADHRKWLLDQQVYFASPAQFNDPFDCSINYRYDLLSPEEKNEKYYDMLRKDKSHLTDEQIKVEVEKWLTEGLLEEDAMLENNTKILKATTDSQVGILSLTKTNTPILLWSHYADNHKGICIGYDYDVLRADFITKYNNPKKVFFESDVTYSKEYPIVIPRKGIPLEEYVVNPLCTKSKVWEYEQEFRIFILGATRELTTVPKEAIVEVTMGCKMSDKDQYEVGDYVIKNLQHTALYLAKMHHESYELIFNKMNLTQV